jgi:hypothetical protein
MGRREGEPSNVVEREMLVTLRKIRGRRSIVWKMELLWRLLTQSSAAEL